MTEAEALAKIREAGRRDAYFITGHARERLRARGLKVADVRHG